MKRVLVLVLLVLSSLLVPTAAYAAEPAQLGTLSFDPKTGLDSTRSLMSTVSSGAADGCPTGTTYVSARAKGPGGWSGGLLALGTTDQDLSTSSEFTIGLSDTWAGIARTNSTTVTAGRYDITLSCLDETTTTSFGVFTGTIWFSDATHFQDTDPATSSRPTETALTTSPADVADLGTPVTLTATVTPSDAVGTVSFTNDSGQGPVAFGSPVTIASGKASLRRTDLPLGLYTFTATFRSTNGRTLTSTSSLVTFAVRKPPPPVNRVLPSVRGTLRPRYRMTCNRGSWTGATKYQYRWLRNGALVGGATATSYLLSTRDVGKTIACRIYASNSGGTIVRASKAWRVARG